MCIPNKRRYTLPCIYVQIPLKLLDQSKNVTEKTYHITGIKMGKKLAKKCQKRQNSVFRGAMQRSVVTCKFARGLGTNSIEFRSKQSRQIGTYLLLNVLSNEKDRQNTYIHVVEAIVLMHVTEKLKVDAHSNGGRSNGRSLGQISKIANMYMIFLKINILLKILLMYLRIASKYSTCETKV